MSGSEEPVRNTHLDVGKTDPEVTSFCVDYSFRFFRGAGQPVWNSQFPRQATKKTLSTHD
jgi:hypothetical protein